MNESRNERVVLLLALLASVALVLAVHATDVILTQDGPRQVYLGHIGNHFMDPGAVYPKYYEPGKPLSVLGFSFLSGPLQALFGWREALRLACAAIALTWGWGLFSLMTSAQKRPSPLALVGFGTALPWALYMGFFSYTLSTAVGFFTLAVALGAARWSGRRWLVLGTLLLLQAVFDVFAAAATAVTLGALVALAAPKAEWRRDAGRLVLILLPVGAIGLLSAAWISRFVQSSGTPSELPSPGFLARLALVPQTFAGGPAWRSLVPVAIALAGVASAFRRARSLSRRNLALLGAALVFLALSIVVPLHARSWDFLSPRFVPNALVLGWLLVRDADLGRGRARSGIGLGVAVWVAASIGWSVHFQRELSSSCADLLALLDAPVKHAGPRLPIILDATCGLSPAKASGPMPYLEPAFNVGPLFAVEQGGVVPGASTRVPERQPFVLSERGEASFPPIPERLHWRPIGPDPTLGSAPESRGDALTQLASYGAHYDDVILWGKPSDADTLLGFGYDVEARQGGALLARFRGCPLTLGVSSRSRIASVHVEYGWTPVETAFWKSTVVLQPKGEGSSGSVVIPKTPCGRVWVEVRTESGAACRGADANGRFSIVTPVSPRIGCLLD